MIGIPVEVSQDIIPKYVRQNAWDIYDTNQVNYKKIREADSRTVLRTQPTESILFEEPL